MSMLYIATLRQQCLGEDTITTYNLFGNTAVSTNRSEAIANILAADWLTAINAAQGVQVVNVDLYVRNATTSENAFTLALSGGGARAAAGTAQLPAWVTAAVRWELGTTQYGLQDPVIKKSFTRISGLLDADVSEGRLSGSWDNDFGDALVTAWIASVATGGDVYTPSCHVNPTGGANTWRIRPQIDAMGWKLGSQLTRKR